MCERCSNDLLKVASWPGGRWPPVEMPPAGDHISSSDVSLNQMFSNRESYHWYIMLALKILMNWDQAMWILQIKQFLWWPQKGFVLYFYHRSRKGIISSRSTSVICADPLYECNVDCWSERDIRKHMWVKHWTLNKKGWGDNGGLLWRIQGEPLIPKKKKLSLVLVLRDADRSIQEGAAYQLISWLHTYMCSSSPLACPCWQKSPPQPSTVFVSHSGFWPQVRCSGNQRSRKLYRTPSKKDRERRLLHISKSYPAPTGPSLTSGLVTYQVSSRLLEFLVSWAFLREQKLKLVVWRSAWLKRRAMLATNTMATLAPRTEAQATMCSSTTGCPSAPRRRCSP